MLCHIMVLMFDLRSNLFMGGELVAPIIFVICQHTLSSLVPWRLPQVSGLRQPITVIAAGVLN
jgi:hypothetical protein